MGRRNLTRSLVLILGSAILGISANAFSPNRIDWLAGSPGAQRISPAALALKRDRGEAVLLLDLRGEEAYRAGHPRGAVNVPWDRMMKAYASTDLPALLRSAREIILLCDSDQCDVADRAARQLRSLGHSEVRILQDGWRGYQSSRLEIERP